MYIAPTSIEQMLQPIIQQSDKDKSKTWLLMFGEQDLPDITQLIQVLNTHHISFFGGVFPGVVFQEKKYERGLVAEQLPANIDLLLVQELDSPDFEIGFLPNIVTCNDALSALVLVDGLTANIASFLRRLYDIYGDNVNYMGGGAGSLTLEQMPCVFNQEGIFQDAAIVAFTRSSSSLGIRHGWQKIVEPFLATNTTNNVISELNWGNAFEVYRDVVEESSGERLLQNSFFDIAKGYPFGITKEGLEVVVRDPIMVNAQGDLVCVGEVPQNASLAILKGDKQNLIKAAKEAAEACDNSRQSLCMVFDCISRVLFLEDDFDKELQAVKKGLGNPAQLLGALTLGEISSYGDGYIEFFNKTIVVGALHT
ncbi:FIST signal transduction protein [Microscilla marina]|uniref:Histidine kinase n=1 Tax=Microscilla marina ATCC 23134 TaxID=313606 RepID=A1ZS99_MICM2|nr:FIST C-terminal domain-containing protein [Microscilla marina]EAY26822.1 conserved hypothetical protein [Microscilla marina ATCC 23134]